MDEPIYERFDTADGRAVAQLHLTVADPDSGSSLRRLQGTAVH